MKKSLLVVFGAVLIVSLSACGSKTNNVNDEWSLTSNDQESLQENNVEVSVQTPTKTSLSEEDFVSIDKEKLPESYSYQVYQADSNDSVASWDFVYPSRGQWLLPEYEDISSKRIISSDIENWLIYTVTEVIFKDGSTGMVSYINDPVSLKYLAAVVENSGSVVLYNFSY